jgi:hypothetical protein
MIRINQTKEPFTRSNFPEFKKNTYKQRIFELKHAGLIEKVYTNRIAYYRVKGFRLDPFWENLTAKGIGAPITNDDTKYDKQDKFFKFLETYFEDLEDPALHNIRLYFYADYLYENVKFEYEKNRPQGVQFIPENKSYILCPSLPCGEHRSVKIILTTTNRVQVLVKSTLKPLAYDEHGMYELLTILGKVELYLTSYHHKIPQPTEWMFEGADFGQDSKKPVHKFPSLKFKDMTGALVQIYAKKWKSQRRLRVEKEFHPEKPLAKVIEDAKDTTRDRRIKFDDIIRQKTTDQTVPTSKAENSVIQVEKSDEQEDTTIKILNTNEKNSAPAEDIQTPAIPSENEYIPKDGDVIGIQLTGLELYENPDWEKFSDDPEHIIVYRESDDTP